MSDYDDTLLTAGRTLAALKLTPEQARILAERAVNIAATSEGNVGALRSDLLAALKDRAVTYAQVDQIASAVERVLASKMTLTEARKIVAAMWSGAIIMQSKE